MRVQIINKTRVFARAIFRIDEVRFRHELYSGQLSDELTRLVLDRGDAVAALVHDRERDTLLFTEQFRVATHEKGPGWMLEVPAGMIDGNETPEACLSRELFEEIGYRLVPESVQHIGTFYLSPGGTSERIYLYYVPVSEANRVNQGGGLAAEGENIRTVTLGVDEVMQRLDHNGFADAKTLIALQWLQVKRIQDRC